MRHRMGFLVIVGLVASLVSTTSGQGANDPAGADVAAHDFLQKATAEITRLENDITALEAAWTKQFVGRLGRESAPIPADDLLDPLRSAQREVDRLRRGLHGQGVAAGGAQLDRYAEVAAQTTFERWRLTLAETALSVELAGQEYERAATEARRMGARPEQREAAVRREREARTLAGRSLAVAREGLRRARETVFATLGSLEEALRRAGRASAAGALESRIDTELNVTAAGDTAVRTALDRFLSAQTIVIEDPVGEERPQPLTLSGALTPLDLAATPAPAAALDVVRLAPAGEYERAPELGFERGHRIELTFDREPGVGRHEAVVQWREGLEARTLTIPIASDNGRSHYSDPFEIWP